MIWVLLSVLGAADAPQISVAAPGLSTVGLEQGLGELYSEHLAQQLRLRGLRVITAKDIGTMLGVERQRALLGCGDQSTECMTELVNALGTESVLTGEIGKIGSVVQVNLKVLSPTNARTLASFTRRVDSEDAVLPALEAAARSLVEQVSQALGRSVPELAPAARAQLTDDSGPSKAFWAPAAVGVVAGVVGVVLLVDARAQYSELLRTDGEPLNPTRAASVRQQGERNQLVGGVLVGVAAAGVAGTALWYFLGRSSTSASAFVMPGAAGVSIAGTLP